MDRFPNDHDTFATAEDAAAQRTGARDSFLLTAQLRIGGSDTPLQVRVRNLSTGGMMAEHAGAVTVGDPARVEIRGIGEIDGHVAWTAEGRIGIAFAKDIDPRRARKPVAAKVRPPAPKRARSVL